MPRQSGVRRLSVVATRERLNWVALAVDVQQEEDGGDD